MKNCLFFLLFVPSVYADIKQEFVTSAQITVDMPFVTTRLIKVGSTYSLSGNNVTPSVTVEIYNIRKNWWDQCW